MRDLFLTVSLLLIIERSGGIPFDLEKQKLMPENNMVSEINWNEYGEESQNNEQDINIIDVDVDNSVKFVLDSLKPINHVKAIDSEQHKELFLGEREKSDIDINTENVLALFLLLDVDSDLFLSKQEIETWIKIQLKEHYDEAVKENEEIFTHLGQDANAAVAWDTFYLHLLLALGYPHSTALGHIKGSKEIKLRDTEKSQLKFYRDRWNQVDKFPTDNALSRSELLAFRHREMNNISLDDTIVKIMNKLDTNEDGVLSEEEFRESYVMDNFYQFGMLNESQEFREFLDRNKDGSATKDELKWFLDPQNLLQAEIEAINLLSLLDEDKDGQLSPVEVLKQQNEFLFSRVANLVGILHSPADRFDIS